MFARGSDAAYRRSQLATGTPVHPSPIARGLALRVLDAGDDAAERQRIGQHLLDELNQLSRLPDCRLVVADRPQVHHHDGQRLRSKTYGYYSFKAAPEGGLAWARIRIYHRTAVQQRVVSAKVFLNTLLHEWVHHSDFHGLSLPRSYHTSGFFKRLRALADALEVGFVLPPDPENPGPAGAPNGQLPS